jgi:glycine cleavage system aminomethyltransferase T
MDKGQFIGRDALARKEKGVTRKLIGFEMRGRGIARWLKLAGRKGGGLSPAVRPRRH